MIKTQAVVSGCGVLAVLLAASHASGAPAPTACGPATASVNDLSDRGREQVRNGRFAEAEACFLRAREQQSGTVQWTNLGSLYWDWAKDLHAARKDDESKRRLAQSAAAFEGAFKAKDGPPPAAVHHLLAGDYFNLGQKDKAIAELESCCGGPMRSVPIASARTTCSTSSSASRWPRCPKKRGRSRTNCSRRAAGWSRLT